MLAAASGETCAVGCVIALLALISARLALFLLWIFSDVLSRAFDSWIIPLLGFFLLPWTTLSYAAFWDWGAGHHVTGFEWFFVVLAFLIDLGSYGQGQRARAARVPDEVQLKIEFEFEEDNAEFEIELTWP